MFFKLIVFATLPEIKKYFVDWIVKTVEYRVLCCKSTCVLLYNLLYLDRD